MDVVESRISSYFYIVFLIFSTDEILDRINKLHLLCVSLCSLDMYYVVDDLISLIFYYL